MARYKCSTIPITLGPVRSGIILAQVRVRIAQAKVIPSPCKCAKSLKPPRTHRELYSLEFPHLHTVLLTSHFWAISQLFATPDHPQAPRLDVTPDLRRLQGLQINEEGQPASLS